MSAPMELRHLAQASAVLRRRTPGLPKCADIEKLSSDIDTELLSTGEIMRQERKLLCVAGHSHIIDLPLTLLCFRSAKDPRS